MIKTIVEYRWDIEPFWFKFKIFIEFKIENLRFYLEHGTDIYLNEHIFLISFNNTGTLSFSLPYLLTLSNKLLVPKSYSTVTKTGNVRFI